MSGIIDLDVYKAKKLLCEAEQELEDAKDKRLEQLRFVFSQSIAAIDRGFTIEQVTKTFTLNLDIYFPNK